jgi:hypothetical protein
MSSARLKISNKKFSRGACGGGVFSCVICHTRRGGLSVDGLHSEKGKTGTHLVTVRESRHSQVPGYDVNAERN